MFNLIEKLNNLDKEYGKDIQELHSVVESLIPHLLNKSEVLMVESVLMNLKRFDYLPVVKSFIDDCINIANENHNKFLLEKTIGLMEQYNDPIYYQLTDKLKAFEGNEKDIANSLKAFEGWDFVKEISFLRESVFKHSFGISKLDYIKTNSNLYTPTYLDVNENKITFNIGYTYFDYNLSTQTVTETATLLSDDYIRTCQIFRNCIVESDGSILYNSNNINYKISGEQLYVGGAEVVENHYEYINKALGGMNVMLANDLYHLWEQRKTILNLDFVTQISDTHPTSVNSPTMYFFNIKESEKTYLYVVNGTQSLFNETTLKEGIKTIKESFGYDLTNLFDSVEDDAVKENERLNKEKSEIVKMLEFLQSKKNDILEGEELNATTTKMLKLLEREIETKQKELKQYHRLLGTNLVEQNMDIGYLHGKLGYAYNGLQKGLDIFINSKMYERCKDDELVEIKTISNSIYNIPKKMLIV